MSYYINVDMDVHWDDIVDQIDDDMVEELYLSRFGDNKSSWDEIYEKRQMMSLENFMKFIDAEIQSRTGRIITV